MTELKIRDLNIGDVLKLSSILSEGINDFRKEAKTFDNGMNSMDMGLLLFQVVLSQLDTPKIKEWIASLVDVSIKELETWPAEKILEIIDELQKKDDVENFIIRVTGLLQTPKIFGEK